jgi:predicted CopG family antitoxin
MQRKLTITVADDVYPGLHQRVGRGDISRFIESLVRPYVTDHDPLEAMYREASMNADAEREAREWIEGNVDDALL